MKLRSTSANPLSDDRSHVVRFSWRGAATLLLVAVLIWAVGLGLNGDLGAIFGGPQTAFGFNAEAALEGVSNSGEIMTAVLAIAITVVAIVVELAANRYSHRVTTLFLRAPVNLVILSLFAVTALQCVWLAFGLGGQSTEVNAGVLITLGLISASLLLLLPYFAYVLGFISPLNIIHRIAAGGAQAIDRAAATNDFAQARQTVALTIEDLQDVTRKAVEQSDRGVAMASTNALFSLLEHYRLHRSRLPEAWFALDAELADDPDFVAMEADALRPVRENGLWLELKVFRQLISSVAQAVPALRDLASLVAINTRMLGERYGPADTAFLSLCSKAFNSYLRASINAHDPRTSYYLLNQYRMLADGLVRAGASDGAVSIAEHFRYYGQLAHHENQPFLLEVAAYDLVHLIQSCRAREDADPLDITDHLISVLLELDLEILGDREEPSLIGVRRAQMQLAAQLLQLGDTERVARIVADLAAEPEPRLAAINEALRKETRSEYWELTERGIVFEYLAPDLHKQLEVLSDQVAAYRAAHGQFLQDA